MSRRSTWTSAACSSIACSDSSAARISGTSSISSTVALPVAPGVDLVPADGAQPREQRRLPAKGAQLAHGEAQRGLRHFFRGVFLLVHARQGEPVDAREHALEELLEGQLVALEELIDERLVVARKTAHGVRRPVSRHPLEGTGDPNPSPRAVGRRCGAGAIWNPGPAGSTG
jgi:hypothetical protein